MFIHNINNNVLINLKVHHVPLGRNFNFLKFDIFRSMSNSPTYARHGTSNSKLLGHGGVKFQGVMLVIPEQGSN